MLNGTKERIESKLLYMLNNKPISNIQVTDLCASCSINRNTFYRYFRNIPDVVVNIADDETDSILERQPGIENIEQDFIAAENYADEHFVEIKNVYTSLGRKKLEECTWKICTHASDSFWDRCGVMNEPAIHYGMACELFGFVLSRIQDVKNLNIKIGISRICEHARCDYRKLTATNI